MAAQGLDIALLHRGCVWLHRGCISLRSSNAFACTGAPFCRSEASIWLCRGCILLHTCIWLHRGCAFLHRDLFWAAQGLLADAQGLHLFKQELYFAATRMHFIMQGATLLCKAMHLAAQGLPRRLALGRTRVTRYSPKACN